MALHIAKIVESLVWLGMDTETIATLIKEEIKCLTINLQDSPPRIKK